MINYTINGVKENASIVFIYESNNSKYMTTTKNEQENDYIKLYSYKIKEEEKILLDKYPTEEEKTELKEVMKNISHEDDQNVKVGNLDLTKQIEVIGNPKVLIVKTNIKETLESWYNKNKIKQEIKIDKVVEVMDEIKASRKNIKETDSLKTEQEINNKEEINPILNTSVVKEEFMSKISELFDNFEKANIEKTSQMITKFTETTKNTLAQIHNENLKLVEENAKLRKENAELIEFTESQSNIIAKITDGQVTTNGQTDKTYTKTNGINIISDENQIKIAA
ncbi:MAG: hypothetical protein ACK5HP_02450 [Bacilli bacterium]